MNKYEPVKDHFQHELVLKRGSGPHKGKFVCKQCNKFVKWATREEIDEYHMLKKVKKLNCFITGINTFVR